MLILIAEEEMPTAAALEAALTEAGHQVLGPVDTIAEALPMIAVERPDLALVSILLKDGDTGVWLAWELLHQHGTPSIFLATDLPHARMSRDLALGVIPKPYDTAMMADIVGYFDELAQERPPRSLPPQLEIFR